MMRRWIVHGRNSPVPGDLSWPNEWGLHPRALTKGGLTFIDEAPQKDGDPDCGVGVTDRLGGGQVEFKDGQWRITADPAGRFPLFYVPVGDRILLSDRPHALLGFLPRVAAEPLAVSEYLLTGSVFPTVVEGTLLKGLSRLAPHQTLIVTGNGFSFEADGSVVDDHGSDDPITRLRIAIDRSTADAVRGHRRVACLVSGGLDSCGLAATALRLEPEHGHQTILLHVGGGLGTAQEQRLRAQFSDGTGRPIIAVEPDESRGVVAALEEANRQAAYPMGCSFASIFESIGSAAVDLECSKVLSGDGGDELFCTPPYLASEVPLRQLRNLLAAVSWKRRRSQRSFLAEYGRGLRERLALSNWMSRAPRTRGSALSGAPKLVAEIEIARELIEHGGFLSQLEEFLGAWWRSRLAISASGEPLCDEWLARQWRLVPTYEPCFSYLPTADPRHRLEVACPLASEDVFRLVASQPFGEHCRFLSEGVGKDLLRKVLADRLPREVCQHPKIGAIDDANLDQALERELPAISRLLHSPGLVEAGVEFPQDADFRLLRHTLGSGCFYRLIILAAWLEGVLAHARNETPAQQSDRG